MATTLVLVFFIDSFSELTTDFNRTMGNKMSDLKSIEQNCPAKIADSVLKKVKEEFNLNIKTMGNNKTKPNFGIPRDLYDGRGEYFENSIYDSNNAMSFEKMQINDVQHDSFKNNIDSGCEKESTSRENFMSNSSAPTGSLPDFPKKAPFLVAIFETLSNVTAQTCAGALLSPHWVITAASCVNVLGHLHNNKTNTGQSHYTIIAQATNPFNDGTAHNVTEVIVHPTHKTVFFGKTVAKEWRGPTLAMMRIEPGVAAAGLDNLDIFKYRAKLDAEARAYGWVYLKNSSNADAMKSVTIPVRIEPENVCNSDATRQWKALCLTTNDVVFKNISLLGSGGPVLALQRGRARLLAVLHTDDRALLAAAPLHPHANWIRSTLKQTPY